MGGKGWFWTQVSAAALFLSGCVGSEVPVLDIEQAVDLGPTWSYQAFVEGDPKVYGNGSWYVFTRSAGVRYDLTLLPGSWLLAREALVAPFGMRGDDSVFLVQLDADYLPEIEGANEEHPPTENVIFYMVALRPDGIGVVAILDCKDERLLSLAAAMNIRLVADRGSPREPECGYLGIEGDKVRIQPFLKAALERDLLEWEDTIGFSFVTSVLSRE